MSTPKIPQIDDFDNKYEKALKLETDVKGLMHHEMKTQAHKLFDKEWENTILVDLPLRIPFQVTRLEKKNLAILIQQEESPFLELKSKVDPRKPEAVAVVMKIADKYFVLGFIPEDIIKIIHKTQEKIHLYELKILQIAGLEEGKLSLQMELVRPDLNQCGHCGILYTENDKAYKSCRKRQCPKKVEENKTEELPPVPLQGAVNEIVKNPIQSLKIKRY